MRFSNIMLKVRQKYTALKWMFIMLVQNVTPNISSIHYYIWNCYNTCMATYILAVHLKNYTVSSIFRPVPFLVDFLHLNPAVLVVETSWTIRQNYMYQLKPCMTCVFVWHISNVNSTNDTWQTVATFMHWFLYRPPHNLFDYSLLKFIRLDIQLA